MNKQQEQKMVNSNRAASQVAIKASAKRMTAEALKKSQLNPAFDPANYTPEQLGGIIRAFFDITDGIQAHEFAERTGDSDPASAENFANAQKLVQDNYRASISV